MSFIRRYFSRLAAWRGAREPKTSKDIGAPGADREGKSPWREAYHFDALFLFVLTSVAFGLGATLFALASPGRIWLYQPIFGSAVMAAAGHGFVEPVVTPDSDLDKFLKSEVEAFDVNTLPENPPTLETIPPTASQSIYLLWCVSAVWKVFGVSWSSVAALAGFLYALNAAFVYGLFRLIARPIPSALLALLLVLSPVQLGELTALRDFSKAPFIAGGIWALGRLVLARPARAPQLGWSMVLGSIVGIGMGFRQDLLVFVPFCLLILPFVSEDTLARGWKLRMGRTAAFFAAFAVTAFPILSGARAEGTNTFHVMTMGLISPFSVEAGLTDASYSPGYVYKDPAMVGLIRNHAYRSALRDGERVGDVVRPESIAAITFPGKRYDDASASFYFDYVCTFPWDVAMRGYAAVLRVLDFAPMSPHWDDQVVTWDLPDFETRWMEARWDLLGFLYGTGKYLFAAAVLFAGAIRVRYGLALALLTLYFVGITSLQFDTRHYFHLEFVYWWMLLFVVHVMWTALSRLHERGAVTVGGVTGAARCLRRTGATIAILAAIAGLPLVSAWAVQSRNVNILSRQWHDAALEKIAVTPEPQPHGRALIPGTQLLDETRANEIEMAWAGHAEYIVLEFEGNGEMVPLDFEYAGERSHYDFTHRVNVRLPETGDRKRLRVFVPMLFDRESAPEGIAAWFKGISFPDWYLPNLVNVARVADVAPFPFMFYAAVPEDLGAFRRGLRIAGENAPYYVRERRALRENLLANGGFEKWNTKGGASIAEGFGMPVESILQPETAKRFEGRYAARQVWTESDGGNFVLEQFRIEALNRRPNVSFEMFGRALNFSNSDLVFHASERKTDASGQTLMRDVGPYFMRVKPTRWFQQFHGSFGTGPGESWTLVISIHYYGEEGGAAAVWDDFRLVERAEPVL